MLLQRIRRFSDSDDSSTVACYFVLTDFVLFKADFDTME